MIICPNCKHSNGWQHVLHGVRSAISRCGYTHYTNMDTGQGQETAPRKFHPHQPAAVALNTWITLHLMDTGQVIPLNDRSEFTLGRISDGQPSCRIFDLSPYQAYAHGVSRLHAVIKQASHHVLVMDLGSVNGNVCQWQTVESQCGANGQ